jgi:hypothetical protein
MAYDRSIIAPFNSGWETDLPPWMLPEDAFRLMVNAYVWRGVARKRFGSRLMGGGSGVTAQLRSRLSVELGITDGTGAATGTVPGSYFDVGQAFSIGNEIFTVATLGNPTVLLSTTGTSTTRTYDTSNGNYVFAGAAADTPIYFYPATPVMGLAQYQVGATNNQPSFGFDTQFAYYFDSTLLKWVRSHTAGVPLFHGTNAQFFWTCNWRGITPDQKVLFVTNFNATVGTPGVNDDSMFGYNGTTWFDFSAYTKFLTAGDFVKTARIIVPFKNRLLLLNTIEQNSGGTTNSQYVNRCRFSHNGSPFSNNAWLEPKQTNGGSVADGAGFIDAPTEEAIVTVKFIKDRLIVWFERSTWEIVYTGNQLLPFVWQKINTELGAVSTFSSVPFDKAVLAIGSTGVHACNGANVERIDNKIPTRIWEVLQTNNGTDRVHGIRDFYGEMVYWSFPESNQKTTQPFPSRILVYNYQNSSWSVNDDTITCFGYFDQGERSTWQNSNFKWEEASFSWDSGSTASRDQQILAGNQQGFIYVINIDVARNAPSRQISRILQLGPSVQLTIKNHMFVAGDIVALENIQGAVFPESFYQVISASDADNIIIGPTTFTGSYTGGGTVAKVSNIFMYSKQWNPYVDQGRNVYLAKINFCVKATASGQITMDYFTNSTNYPLIYPGNATGSQVGTNVLETSPYESIPYERFQERLWHPVYFQADGEFVQVVFYMNLDQILDPSIAWQDFRLEGMILYTSPTASDLR